MILERRSPCKINLVLNILGKRPDGFHDLETVLCPLPWHDHLRFSLIPAGIELICNDKSLPTDSSNLIHRAAAAFLESSEITAGIRVHLHKRIPVAAGLGGGSSNAAVTLLALNELFGEPLSQATLTEIARQIGADVAFFLQSRPALATGRGDLIQPLDEFPALRGACALLIYPGFGISTAWAYAQLGRHPGLLPGQPGRARRLIDALQSADLSAAAGALFNSLEKAALEKFPLLALFQEFLRAEGAVAALMSGSGSTTFALASDRPGADRLRQKIHQRFGDKVWSAVVPVSES